MKTILTLICLLFLTGCTMGSFNPETNEFYFMSSKEFDHFEIKFKDGDKEVSIIADKVKAFKGQRALFDSLSGNLNPLN